MTPEEEERWFDRLAEDDELLDAVMDGQVPFDEAPDSYPQLWALFEAARNPVTDEEVAARDAVLAQLSDEAPARAERNAWWRRILRKLGLKVLVGSVAIGVGAAGAAAATGGDGPIARLGELAEDDQPVAEIPDVDPRSTVTAEPVLQPDSQERDTSPDRADPPGTYPRAGTEPGGDEREVGRRRPPGRPGPDQTDRPGRSVQQRPGDHGQNRRQEAGRADPPGRTTDRG